MTQTLQQGGQQPQTQLTLSAHLGNNGGVPDLQFIQRQFLFSPQAAECLFSSG